MRLTKNYLKNLLRENGVTITSNNLLSLLMIAVENNLVSKDSLLEGAKECRHVGRPKRKCEN
jgi:hypothetical protein